MYFKNILNIKINCTLNYKLKFIRYKCEMYLKYSENKCEIYFEFL